MATITETALFKACVEAPRGAAQVVDLNLENIDNPRVGLQFLNDEVL